MSERQPHHNVYPGVYCGRWDGRAEYAGTNNEELQQLGRQMREQDNRMTRNPIWLVVEKRPSDRVLSDLGRIFFTQQAAEMHIHHHRYEFAEPIVYAASVRSNLLTALLRSLADGSLMVREEGAQ